MSITATGPHASIWPSATPAPGTPAATPAALPSKPNEAGVASSPAGRADPARSTPFQQLSSDLHSVLIQMQGSYGKGKGSAAG